MFRCGPPEWCWRTLSASDAVSKGVGSLSVEVVAACQWYIGGREVCVGLCMCGTGRGGVAMARDDGKVESGVRGGVS